MLKVIALVISALLVPLFGWLLLPVLLAAAPLLLLAVPAGALVLVMLPRPTPAGEALGVAQASTVEVSGSMATMAG